MCDGTECVESDHIIKTIPKKVTRYIMYEPICKGCDWWSGKVGTNWIKAHCNKHMHLMYEDDTCEFFTPIRERDCKI